MVGVGCVAHIFDTCLQTAVCHAYWNRGSCDENLLVFLHLHYVCVTQVKWKT